ncbi:hypothetical protein GGE09_002133 [Roseobacter sp. N2S]|nr:hypothetical protein [Roseobacter sp. N2S]
MPIWMLGDENRAVPSSDGLKYNGSASYDKRKYVKIQLFGVIFLISSVFRARNSHHTILPAQIFVQADRAKTGS